jgi:hypothetical protein
MKINQLASKPKLIKLEIADEDTVAQYGEAVEFWTYDRQPLEVFMQLAENQGVDPKKVIDLVRTMILDEKGEQVIQGEVTLPTGVLLKIIEKIVETLGK